MPTQHTDRYYVRIRGKVVGPFPVEQLESLRDRNRLQADHEVSNDRRQWRPASQIPGLFGDAAEPAFVENSPAAAESPASTDTSAAPLGHGSPWHYSKGDQEYGPVDWAALQQMAAAGQLEPRDEVWTPSMTGWKVAESVPGLYPPNSGRRGVKDAVVKASRDYQKIASRTALDGLLDHVRTQITADDLEASSRLFIKLGGFAFLIAMLAGPGFLVVQAVRMDSIRVGFLSAAAFFGLLVVKYAAERLSVACHALVQSSATRLSSSAFVDSVALCLLFGAVGSTAACVLWGLQQDSLIETVVWIAGGAQFLAVFGYAGCAALHPQWLSIDCSSDIRAGEEGIGIMAFLLKLCLRMAPVQFGANAILGAAAATIALVLLIIGGERTFDAMQVAFYSLGFIATAGAVPLFFYLLMSFSSVLLDLSASIFLLPEKIDALKE